jgi:hypothetical protein
MFLSILSCTAERICNGNRHSLPPGVHTQRRGEARWPVKPHICSRHNQHTWSVVNKCSEMSLYEKLKIIILIIIFLKMPKKIHQKFDSP